MDLHSCSIVHMATCLHETLQLTDEHRIIICGSCGREFGHIMRDDRETFVAYASKGKPIAVLATEEYDDITEHTVALGVQVEGAHFFTETIYPCRTCEWAGTCGQEGELCHS